MELHTEAKKALALPEDDPNKYNLGGSSDGFWYDLTLGGKFSPADVLERPADIQRVNEAVKTLKELERIYTQLTPEY